MSFKCQSQSGAIAKAINSVGLSGTSNTLAGWFRRDAAGTAGNNCIGYFGTSSNGLRLQMDTTANGGDVRFMQTNGFNGSDSVFTVSDGEWVYVAVLQSAGSFSGHAWRDTTGESRTSLGTNSTSSFTPDRYIIGGDSNVAPFWIPARGEYVHWRYWNAVLTTTELNAERLSATPVRTSNLVGSHPLANSTDTSDNSGNGNVLTITGTTDLTTGSGAPTSIGTGGSSVAPIVAYYTTRRD
jgi:hypothetical protein